MGGIDRILLLVIDYDLVDRRVVLVAYVHCDVSELKAELPHVPPKVLFCCRENEKAGQDRFGSPGCWASRLQPDGR